MNSRPPYLDVDVHLVGRFRPQSILKFRLCELVTSNYRGFSIKV
jgi:hypothetical protein